MPYSFLIRCTMTKPAEVTVRGWREVVKNAFRAMALLWHRDYLPRHFDGSKQRRYGFTARTVKYIRSKLSKKGHATDLVWSGRTRDAAMSTPSIQAYPTRARIRLAVPPYAARKPDARSNKRPNLPAEIARVTPDEQRELADFVAARTAENLKEWFETKKVTFPI